MMDEKIKHLYRSTFINLPEHALEIHIDVRLSAIYVWYCVADHSKMQIEFQEIKILLKRLAEYPWSKIPMWHGDGLTIPLLTFHTNIFNFCGVI